MELMTSRRLFYQSHEHIRVWNLNHFHTLFTVLGFEIVTSRRVVSSGFPTRLLLHGEDGAIRIVSPSDGTIITTMFPLQTLPESIVDYAYNPREDRLYVVLSSGAVLVFNTRTNPCSTYELWKCDALDSGRVTSTSLTESYGVNCVAMMNIEEISEIENEKIYYTLLFAGLNNGHISLVYSNELSMHDTIEAHYGKIALLRVSEGLEREDPNSFHSALLVSCGTDCELKIWKIVFRNYSAKIISLELWSMVKLMSIPCDIELIGYTIGLVMDNNSLMTCRVKSEEERPARSPHSRRNSVSRNDHYDIECFTSAAEETHSKAITGLSACATLGLFATSSNDWSVKIWNKEAKLVKEICFEESLRGVCFANPRGDLLVGFQSHISIVPLTNYLPLKLLEMLSTMEFPDDVFEDHLPFDRMLSFSYDPLRTPCLPLDLGQRRLILQEKNSLKPTLRIPSTLLLLDNEIEDASDNEEADPAFRRYSTTEEQEKLDERLRKFQRSSLSTRSSALHSPILEEVIARITQSFSSRSEIATANQKGSPMNLIEQLRRLFDNDDSKIPDDYWPCAPDGYIPNSVVRQRVPPKELPPHLVPKLMRGEELKEWIRKTKKKSSIEQVDMPEDYFYPITFDDDELGFGSIFDGYDEALFDGGRSSLLVESDEEEGSSDEEVDLKKKWKASTKTTMNKDTMMSSIKARQSIRERKKVSKKPEMPMIIAAEEEEIDETSREEEKHEETKMIEEQPDPLLPLPPVLRHIIEQPWFPKASLVDGIKVEDIFNEMVAMMASCAPLTYGKICDELLALISAVGVSDEQKTNMMKLVVDNLNHPSASIRRASLKTIQELRFVSNQAVEGIIGCLTHSSREVQQDALNALGELLGIKDKEGLCDLFISINILSRTPSPNSEVALDRIKPISKEKTDVFGTDGDEWRVHKDKYINDWLMVDKESKSAKSLRTESTKIKMASSIVSKLKLYKKPEPRLSIVDLTFGDSLSSRVSSKIDEIEMEEITECTHEIMQKLRKTRAGCKLLSRLACNRTMLDTSKDPLLKADVPKMVETVEKVGKVRNIAKRPPSAIMGFAYDPNKNDGYGDKTDKLSAGMSTTRIQNEGECDRLPYIHVSEISSVSKRSDIQEDINKLVLPKIFNRIKSYRPYLGTVTQNVRRSRLKGEDRLKLPALDDKSQKWKTRMPGSETAEQRKPTKRITFIEAVDSTIDCKKRRSILRKLQRRRLEEEVFAQQRLTKEKRSLSMTSSLRVPSPSEDNILSPGSQDKSDDTPEFHLPKISYVIPGDVTTCEISNKAARGVMPDDDKAIGVISDDASGQLLADDITPIVPGTNVPCSLYTDVVGERLSQRTSLMARKPLGDPGINDEALRVLPVNPKLTIDTGCNKWGRSRYGILEVIWTSRGIYDTQDFEGSALQDVNQKRSEAKIFDNKQRTCVPTAPVAVKKFLKPIRNRNLVANPYETAQYFTKKTIQKLPGITEGVSTFARSNSDCSSRKQIETERLCTIRELLEVENVSFFRSS